MLLLSIHEVASKPIAPSAIRRGELWVYLFIKMQRLTESSFRQVLHSCCNMHSTEVATAQKNT